VIQGTTGRVIVGLLWLTILVIVAAAWSAGASRHRVYGSAPPRTGIGSILGSGDETLAEFPVTGCEDLFESSGGRRPGVSCSEASQAMPRVDLYGNQIDNPIADYRIDRRGDVYERHSPDTEVTHLAAPSM
jgi:hypothetical protein